MFDTCVGFFEVLGDQLLSNGQSSASVATKTEVIPDTDEIISCALYK